MKTAGFVTRLVDELVVGLLNAQLYGGAHPRVVASAEEASKHVGDYCLDRKTGALLL